MKLWITFKPHYHRVGDPREGGFTTYSFVAIFDEEIDALRYANEVGGKCVDILPQETLKDAIARSRLK